MCLVSPEFYFSLKSFCRELTNKQICLLAVSKKQIIYIFFVNFYYFSLNQTMSGVHSRHDLLFLIYQSARKGVNGNKHPIHTNTKVL